MKKVTVLAIIAAFALSGSAAARGTGQGGFDGQPGMDRHKGDLGMYWERERVVEALALTEEEKSRLADLFSEHRDAIRDLREELREERDALREIMEREEFSPSEAKKHFKRAEKARSRIHEERFEMNIEQRELLGPERFVKLRRMERRARGKRHGDQ